MAVGGLSKPDPADDANSAVAGANATATATATRDLVEAGGTDAARAAESAVETGGSRRTVTVGARGKIGG